MTPRRRWTRADHGVHDWPLQTPLAQQQGVLAQLLLLAWLLALVLVQSATLLLDGLTAGTLARLGPGLILAGCAAGAWLLLRRGQLGRAVGVICGATVLVEGYEFGTAGLAAHPQGMLTLVLPLTLAGLVGGRRALLLVGGLSSLLVGAAALYGPLVGPAQGHRPPCGHFVVSFLVVISVLGLFLDRFGAAFRGALEAAERRAAALQREVAEHQRTGAALRQSEERFRALSEHATDLISILGADGTFRYVSPSWQPVMGYAPAALLGRDAFALLHPADASAAQAALATTLLPQEGAVTTLRLRTRHADGSWRTLEALGNNRLHDPAIQGVLVSARDVTERVEAEERLRHQALHDALTDLPNRSLLHDRLAQGLHLSQRHEQPLALLLLDLDRFKEVNDTLGHGVGDGLLQQVAQRLRDAVRASDTVARLGGDEFAVVLPGADVAGAQQVLQTLCIALENPFVVAGQPLVVGASGGIAVCPAHGTEAATLLRKADVALYVAKRAGSGMAVYAASQDEHHPRRLALVADLRQALAQGALTLHYQPQVDLQTGALCGVEALVRWPHPEHGLIPPDQFIPLAEQTGLIASLTQWVLEAALQQGQCWQRDGHGVPVAVNLSVGNLRDPHLVENVAALLQRYAVPAAQLRLELTESALMTDAAHSLAVLTRLSALGVGLSVDDFGTGYSSLAYLKRLPVDELKIDRAFVQHLATDETDAAIVGSTIGLGHSLGLRVVAEGVEDQRSCELLAQWGCDVAQGYYLSRPIPAAALARWMPSQQAGAAEPGACATPDAA